MLAQRWHQATVGPMTCNELSKLHSVAATAEIRGKPHLSSEHRDVSLSDVAGHSPVCHLLNSINHNYIVVGSICVYTSHHAKSKT